MNLKPRYVQIPYRIYMAIKPQIGLIPEKLFKDWVDWGVDMCLNGEMQPVYYMLGDLRLSDSFGFIYTALLADDAVKASYKAINSGT